MNRLCLATVNMPQTLSVDTLLVSSFSLCGNGLSRVYALLLVGSLEALPESEANSTCAGTTPGNIAAMIKQVKRQARVNFNYPLCSATDISMLFSSSWSKDSDHDEDFHEMAVSHS